MTQPLWHLVEINSMTKTRFTSPVGRMVQGDLDTPSDKDMQGNLRTVKSGLNMGQPNPQYFIGVAFAKTDPAWPAFESLLKTQAATDFPALFPGGPTAPSVHPQFAFKIADGDGMDSNGKSNATKEGFAGHWVVRFASSYPPRCFHAGRYAAHEQIQEKGAIKRGYFVRVNGTVEGNGNAQRPGVYVNLDMVELAGYGPEIVSGPDANDAFGGAPVVLPAGATAMPVTPAVGGAAPLAAGGVAPVTPVAPNTAPVSAPYTGYMDPNAVAGAVAPPPPVPIVPTLPTASPTKVMTPAAGGATYEQMIAAGWTDATLAAHGMIAA
jgi:hypothetical protein